MGLKIIYGRSGCGKSQYCFNDIKGRIEKEQGNYNTKKIYIITPEQFSYTAEKKLLEILEDDAVINAEVLTFERMAHRVLTEVEGSNKKSISKSGKAMLIYNILSENKSKLKFLGKTQENVELVATAITEFKKHNVRPENLENAIKEANNKYLKTKLSDLNLMYQKFEENIENKFIDENDNLTKLVEKIDETDMFDETTIYIDEFAGFTSQEYKIIKKLLKKAKEVNVTICTDSIESNKIKESDIFYANKKTIKNLIDLSEEKEIELVPLYTLHRFKNKELLHLEENLYKIPYKKYEQENENIEVFLANNQYSEIENIAREIEKKVRYGGYRYKDISVITKNIDTYSGLIKAIFPKYQIPVFIDEKKDLNQNILVKFILALIEIFSKNWSYEAMFNYIKTGLLDITEEEIWALENYALKWGIKGDKWYKDNWEFDTETNIEVVEIKNKIVEPLLKLKNRIYLEKDVESITKAIYEFLIENKIDKKIANKIEKLEQINKLELANEYKTSYDIIINLLDEMVTLFGKTKISFEKYIELIKIGLKSSELGKIPANSDVVIIGDVDRSRSHKVSIIYIIGLNDGAFPNVHKDEGFLNDSDRENLKNGGIELAKGTVELLYDDNFNIYKALTTAEEKIYLSYASADYEGKSLRLSIFIIKLKKIFTKLKEKSDIIEKSEEILNKTTTFDELLINIRNCKDGKEINPIWFDIYDLYKKDKEWKDKLDKSIKGLNYTNNPERINKENIDKLYGETLKTSVSRLEQYRSCPFSFFLKYGLSLKEKETFKVQSIDTGNFMHDIIDRFFNIISEKEINVKEITEEELEQIIKNIIAEKLNLKKNYIFTSTEKYKVLTYRLEKLIKRAMKYLIYSLKVSDFEVLGNEVEFKKEAEYPPIILKTDDNKKIEITGKIDRIDIANNSDGKFIRIIDYKSSTKNIDLNQVVAGLQIQLLTYLDAVTNIEGAEPAGVLYFNLIDPIIKSDKNLTDEEIEIEIRKQFKMQGLILADVNVIRIMDKTIEPSKASEVVPAYIDAKENVSKTRSNAINKEEFANLQRYINKVIKDISQEILGGNIELKPYNKNGKTPCEYCKYKPICQFNSGICKNSYNYINNISKDAILEMIKIKKNDVVMPEKTDKQL